MRKFGRTRNSGEEMKKKERNKDCTPKQERKRTKIERMEKMGKKTGKAESLREARKKKDNEFYTKVEDIEREILEHGEYRREMEGKTVFCNCDDPEKSNFPKFFAEHFEELKLKKLIATHYNPDGTPSYKMESPFPGFFLILPMKGSEIS